MIGYFRREVGSRGKGIGYILVGGEVYNSKR